MGRIYYRDDADPAILEGKTVAVLGYGNQGRAQALNLRDSGVSIVVGSIPDERAELASDDGFEVRSLRDAAELGDVVMLLIPDEIQREVYRNSIAPCLEPGDAVSFAHGYNIRYGHIVPREDVDVILVAPRMIGVAVRELYTQGSGAPAFVAVQQDATGQAADVALALADGIGSTRSGVLHSTFEEETELDLFSEQAVWPIILHVFESAFELLTARGYSQEAVVMELYKSGEPSRVLAKAAEEGLFRQLRFHSTTSQYGTLSRKERLGAGLLLHGMTRALEEIQSGEFAREWEKEEEASFSTFQSLLDKARSHPINAVEEGLRPVDFQIRLEQ